MGRASSRKARRTVWLRTETVTARTCPVCHAVLDGATEMRLDTPFTQPLVDIPDGSMTVCAYCGAVLLAEGGAFRLATAEEFAELEPDQQRLLSRWPAPGRTKP